MSRPALLTTAARAEAGTAVRWLACRNPEAARGRRQAIADAVKLLGNRPLAGRVQPELVGPRYRIWSLAAYPCIFVYDPPPVPQQILR